MKFKSRLLASVAAVAFATPALAADGNSFTGMYVGFLAGGTQTSSTADLGQVWDYEGYTREHTDPLDADGWLGALVFGSNWQRGHLVFGGEVDFNYLNAQHENYLNYVDSYYDGVLRHKVNWVSTLRGRAGYAVGNTMFYVTGGVALAKIEQSFAVDDKSIRFERSSTKFGWVAGAGIEHMLSQNFSVRFEGLYSRFGSETVTEGGSYYGTDPIAVNFGATTVGMVRVGGALKF